MTVTSSAPAAFAKAPSHVVVTTTTGFRPSRAGACHRPVTAAAGEEREPDRAQREEGGVGTGTRTRMRAMS